MQRIEQYSCLKTGDTPLSLDGDDNIIPKYPHFIAALQFSKASGIIKRMIDRSLTIRVIHHCHLLTVNLKASSVI